LRLRIEVAHFAGIIVSRAKLIFIPYLTGLSKQMQIFSIAVSTYI
jgi:hypothetical protein